MNPAEYISAGKVVIVDDSEVVRSIVSDRLLKAGYEVIALDSGERFADWMEAGQCDALLLDSQMPGRSGLQVLTHVRKRFDRIALPVLFLTAKNDPDHIAAALQSGANDFIVKPFDFQVLLARVELQVKLKRSQEQLMASLAQQRQVQAVLEAQAGVALTELTLAAELQQQIFRGAHAPAQFSLASHFRASSHVSGDILHSMRTADGGTLIFLGDATGHGVAAALITMLVIALLESVPPSVHAPHQLLAWLNDQLANHQLESRYVTGIVLHLAPDGSVRAANAGHPMGVVLGSAGAQFIESSGTPLGWFPGAKYEETAFALQGGDQILMFTDGLTEWPDSQGTHWETCAAMNLALENRQEHPDLLVQRLIDAAKLRAEGTKPPDDVTVVALRYESAAQG